MVIVTTMLYMLLMTLCLILIVTIVTQEDKSTEDFHAVRRTKFLDLTDHTKDGIQRKLSILLVVIFFGLSTCMSAFL